MRSAGSAGWPGLPLASQHASDAFADVLQHPLPIWSEVLQHADAAGLKLPVFGFRVLLGAF